MALRLLYECRFTLLIDYIGEILLSNQIMSLLELLYHNNIMWHFIYDDKEAYRDHMRVT